jgi:hypothetical protein
MTTPEPAPAGQTSAGAPSRRSVLAGAAALLPALAAAPALRAQDAPAEGEAHFLFVQTARSVAFDADENRLTLHGISPVTPFFSDRPERIAGNMKTEAFVPFWSRGSDNFLSDPPNADLSILEDGTLRQAVVVLRDPVLQGEDLHYTVEIIDGEVPVLGESVSVFTSPPS